MLEGQGFAPLCLMQSRSASVALRLWTALHPRLQRCLRSWRGWRRRRSTSWWWGRLPAGPSCRPIPSRHVAPRLRSCGMEGRGASSTLLTTCRQPAAGCPDGRCSLPPPPPPSLPQFMHWTDAFTSRLTARTKLVGSVLTCEGAPKGGDAGVAQWGGSGVYAVILAALPGFHSLQCAFVPYTSSPPPFPCLSGRVAPQPFPAATCASHRPGGPSAPAGHPRSAALLRHALGGAIPLGWVGGGSAGGLGSP